MRTKEPLSLAYIFIRYQLARGRTAFVLMLFLLSCLFIGGVWAFHRSLMDIVVVVGAAGLVILVHQLLLFARGDGAASELGVIS